MNYFLLNRFCFAKTQRLFTFLLFIVGHVMIFEQLIDREERSYSFDKYRVQKRIDDYGSPPEGVDVFYVVPNNDTGRIPALRTQLDAWALSQKYNLKTVNGYSGQNPKHFEEIIHASGSGDRARYMGAIKRWFRINGMNQALGELDMLDNHWRVLKPQSIYNRYQIDGSILIQREGFSLDDYSIMDCIGKGWSHIEKDGIWTEASSSYIHVLLLKKPVNRLTMCFKARAYVNNLYPMQRFSIYVNDRFLANFEMNKDFSQKNFEYNIPETWIQDSRMDIRIDCLNPVKPSSISNSSDDRLLGLRLLDLSFKSTL